MGHPVDQLLDILFKSTHLIRYKLKSPALRVEKLQFVLPISPPPLATHECSQKSSVQSVQPFGRLYATYI